MGWEVVTPSEEVHAADWIRERVHGFAVDVGSVVPHGFDSYARIFHPAWAPHMIEVRWSDVAASTGRTIHPEMQFHSIATPLAGHGTGHASWYEPRNGTLSAGQVRALLPLLARHTSTPDRCLFCLWDGYGYFNPGAIASFRAAFEPEGDPPPPPPLPLPTQPKGRVRMPERDYMLFTGSVAQAEGWLEGPNLWWPDDRAWCVASEIDLPYTYVAGSGPLIAEVLANPELEALPATIRDGIRWDSDIVNS
ncbi:MAG: hypothetical protein WB682_05860 [Candidatus Dormiibacterota bacterium]